MYAFALWSLGLLNVLQVLSFFFRYIRGYSVAHIKLPAVTSNMKH